MSQVPQYLFPNYNKVSLLNTVRNSQVFRMRTPPHFKKVFRNFTNFISLVSHQSSKPVATRVIQAF